MKVSARLLKQFAQNTSVLELVRTSGTPQGTPYYKLEGVTNTVPWDGHQTPIHFVKQSQQTRLYTPHLLCVCCSARSSWKRAFAGDWKQEYMCYIKTNANVVVQIYFRTVSDQSGSVPPEQSPYLTIVSFGNPFWFSCRRCKDSSCMNYQIHLRGITTTMLHCISLSTWGRNRERKEGRRKAALFTTGM